MNILIIGELKESERKKCGEKYNIKTLSGEFSEVAQAMGAYTEKITVPNDIIPSIKRGIAETEAGKAVVLEFIPRRAARRRGRHPARRSAAGS